MKINNLKKWKFLLIPFVSLFLFLIVENWIYSEGIGLLRAGPFKLFIQTKEAEQDFIITIDNRFSSNWLGVYGEGGYYKITKAASNKEIMAPRDWIYSSFFLGERVFSGTIYHPKFLKTFFEIYADNSCERNLAIKVLTFQNFKEHQVKCLDIRGPIRFDLVPIPINEYVKNSNVPIEHSILQQYQSYYFPMSVESIRELIYFEWHLELMKDYLFFIRDSRVISDESEIISLLEIECKSLQLSMKICKSLVSNTTLELNKVQANREREYEVF
ncbi:MAG: hypothetical protein HWE27_18710 [Gammaproteobacteria bacterium]|nr:hypothetical protein [Gammaproteobacteria bacterium]